ncbi:hypothetical protein CAEBREN_14833 [Caenorhabditis brenneri]|uniref:Uncharacterized protein n=1 Tax=Caenorhabditis brenneri TaxID=135651 RepID=G0NAG4_CAEBE|nr:hypothetical protein CAEBREN_14833 [Caenorhabditis brenneri]
MPSPPLRLPTETVSLQLSSNSSFFFSSSSHLCDMATNKPEVTCGIIGVPAPEAPAPSHFEIFAFSRRV